MVKNLPANAGHDGLVPGSGSSWEKKMTTHCRILAREIPWTEQPGGYSPCGHKTVRHNISTKHPQE